MTQLLNDHFWAIWWLIIIIAAMTTEWGKKK